MSLAETTYKIDYPESDGKPLAETELHLHWIFRVRDILKHRLQAERAYVGANMLLYFVKGGATAGHCPGRVRRERLRAWHA